jgi:hypothetical protein
VASSGVAGRAFPFLLGLGAASTSSHSRAPSSRVHCAAGFGFGVPRRRVCSSVSSQARSWSPRCVTWWAPRRATLPHPVAFRGSGGRSSRTGPRVSSREGALRRGAAPARGGPDRVVPERGAADLGAPVRAELVPAADRGRSVRAPAVRGRPVWPALLADERCEVPPELRPVPVLDPEAEPVLELEPVPDRLAPPLPAGRRAPPLLPPVAGRPDWPRRAAPPPAPPRDEGLPAPPRLPCPPPPDRAGRPDPPDRAEEARRFGWEEF